MKTFLLVLAITSILYGQVQTLPVVPGVTTNGDYVRFTTDGNVLASGPTSDSRAAFIFDKKTSTWTRVNDNLRGGPDWKITGTVAGDTSMGMSLFVPFGDTLYYTSFQKSTFGSTTKLLNQGLKLDSFGITDMCTDLSPAPVVGGQIAIASLRGTTPATDGNVYYGGVTYSTNLPGIFHWVSGVGNCTFALDVMTDPSWRILQVWRLADGSFLAEEYPLNPTSLETRIVNYTSKGVATVLFASTGTAKVHTAQCCTLTVDPSGPTVNVSYLGTDGQYHVTDVTPAKVTELYATTRPLLQAVRPRGPYSLVATSRAVTPDHFDTAVLVDTRTGQTTTVYDKSNPPVGMPAGDLIANMMDVYSDGSVAIALSTGSQEMRVYVIPPPVTPAPAIKAFTASNTNITAGDRVTLSWDSTLGDSATITPGVGSVPVVGSAEVLPTTTTTYTLAVTGKGGTSKATVTISVTPVVVVPTPTIAAVVNGASFEQGLAPGTFASVFGFNFVPIGTEATAQVLPLPTTLSGVQVLLNGKPTSMKYVSPTQINFMVPYDTLEGTVTVCVVSSGVIGNKFPIIITTTAPGVFASNNQGIATGPSGQVVTSKNPIQGGGSYTLWLTGLGRTDCPNIGQGSASNAICSALVQPVLKIGGQTAQIAYAGLAPQFPGLYQINFVAPDGPPGTSTLQVEAELSASTAQTRFNISVQGTEAIASKR